MADICVLLRHTGSKTSLKVGTSLKTWRMRPSWRVGVPAFSLLRGSNIRLACTQDPPELADIETNVAACNAHLEFLSAVPSHLSSTKTPSLDTLESAPVGPLIHSNPLFKVTAQGAPSASRQPAPTKDVKSTKTPRRLPKSYDAKKEPDPWRWTKLKERPGKRMSQRIMIVVLPRLSSE